MFKNNLEKLTRIAELLDEQKSIERENKMLESFIRESETDKIRSIHIELSYNHSILPPCVGDGLISAVKYKLGENQNSLMRISMELNEILNTPLDEAKN
jgi:hypothetical protein